MKPITIEPLNYLENSATLFAKVAHFPRSVFLDSCYPFSKQGRFDVIAADPMIILETVADKTTIQTPHQRHCSYDDPFALLKEYLPRIDTHSSLPFHGGAIGYFAYDLARRIEKLPSIAQQACLLPEMSIGIYPWSIVVDHQQQTACLVYLSAYCKPQLIKELLHLLSEPAPEESFTPFRITKPFQSNTSQTYYAHAFKKIIDYITAGDSYEINFTQRFQAEFSGSCWQAYQQLRQQNPAPFAAYLNLPDSTIMSCSPERFLQCRSREINTMPIKGTRRRILNDVEMDKNIQQELLQSEKDRAENLMIVDLMRNDLGKVCEIGSIKVPKLFSLETYANVHHLVSTVCGTLAKDKDIIDLLRACFPGGSITGAPKIRTMEIIEELEPHRRHVYCGSIGYLDVTGNMDTNIAIRTLYTDQNKIVCAAGGAIVADSEVNAEYEECFTKVNNILKILENINLD